MQKGILKRALIEDKNRSGGSWSPTKKISISRTGNSSLLHFFLNIFREKMEVANFRLLNLQWTTPLTFLSMPSEKKFSTIPYTKLVLNKFDLFGQEGNHGMNWQKENERELYNFN